MSIDLSNISDHQKKSQSILIKSSNISGVRINDLFSSKKKKKLNDKKKESFYSELSILISSGVDIKTALEIYVEEQEKKNEKELFTEILNQVLKGSTLSKALENTGRFTPYEYFSLEIGEETGKIDSVFNVFSSFYSRKVKQKKQIRSALSYPILVVCTAIFAVSFMLYYLVPMFSEIFKRFNKELPSLTKSIISISNWFSNNIVFIFIHILALILFYLLYKDKKWLRKLSTSIVLKIPIISNLINLTYLSRFCQSMALLLNANSPLIRTLELIRGMIDFLPYEEAVSTFIEDIKKGELLHRSMQKCNIFPSKVIHLIKVGEEVNQLGKVFDRLFDQYSNELEHKINTFNSLLEPLLIIIVGIFVGIILVAMYLPMFQIGSAAF